MNLEKDIEKAFELPAVALEKGVEFAERGKASLISKKPFRVAEEYLETLGPGLTTGAADDDPSGIATYSQTGASFGFQFLWLSLFTFPLMAIVQEMCARIGIVTGEGLASNIRKRYAPWILYSAAALLFLVNSFNIGADLGAMAEATRLVLPSFSFVLLVLVFATVSLLLQVFTTYARYAKYLKYLTLVLLCYVVTALLVHLDWKSALSHTLIPTFHFTKTEFFLVCAILGTTISPYLFFWQTSQEIEEEILRGERTVEERRASVSDTSLRRMRTDVWSGMFFSNLVMFFITAACAATIGANYSSSIHSAAEAAEALRPLAGNLTYFLFALGIIGTGMLAIPVLAASASYAVSESLSIETGLYKKLREAYGFYGIIICSIAVGLLLEFLHIDPLKSLLYAAIGNGLIAPIILYFVVRMSGDRSIMGSYANSRLVSALGWIVVLLMAFTSLGGLLSLFA